MLRNIHLKSKDVMEEFLISVSETYDIWEKKMKELKKEDERTKAHHTIKILDRFYFTHGV